MSYTTQIKQEIANNDLYDHCKRAQLSALIQLTSSLTLSKGGMGILVRSESPTTAKRTLALLKDMYGVKTKLQVAKKTNLKKNNVYTIEIYDGARTILEDLGLFTDKGLQSHPSYSVVSRDCCARAYLGGAFLAYGSCNDPQNISYHLEISMSDIEHGNFVVKLLSRFNIEAKITKRRNKYIVYIKKADYVSNFLALIGAHDSMMIFENERIGRDLKNSVSRIDNCEIANEVKTIRAAQKQVTFLQKIKDSNEYEKLDEKLKNVVDIRLKYQDYSLLELCDAYQSLYGTVISKSGMKHRLNRLENIAEGL